MSYKINTLNLSDRNVSPYEKRLSICQQTNGFSFSVCSSRDELLAFGEVECDVVGGSLADKVSVIKAALQEAHVTPGSYGQAELIVAASRFEWIPDHLYDGAQNRAYLENLGTIPVGMSVYADFNETLNAYLVFAADSSVVTPFQIALPGLKVRCQHSKMVNTSLVERTGVKPLLLIHVAEGQSDFAVFCNRKLQISNSFPCENFNETLFQALNLTHQFNMEEDTMTVMLCGDVDRSRYAEACHFFKDVQLYTGQPLKLTRPEMQHIPTYRHAILLS